MAKKEKKADPLPVASEVSLGRMRRWYKCQELAKYLFDSTTSDLEVDLLLQQAATGMFENRVKF